MKKYIKENPDKIQKMGRKISKILNQKIKDGTFTPNFQKGSIPWNKGIKKPLLKLICKECKKEFEDDYKHDYCSMSCAAKFRNRNKDPEERKQHSKFMKEYCKNPEVRERLSLAGTKAMSVLGQKKRTYIEKTMKKCLEKNNIDFIEQFVVHIPGTKINFIVDFYIPESKLFIECDGEQFHQDKEKDKKREINILWVCLEHKFLRFTGSEINTNINSCLTKIRQYI